MLRYFIAWFPMLLLAVANGALRDVVYKKFTGELLAHQLSTASLLLLFALYIAFIVKAYPPASSTQALQCGILWLCCTLAFEFGFGFYRGKALHELLHDYNIFEGRIWILIPLWLLVAPPVFYKLFHT
ncbi:hypothetical protein I5907_14880 [Panacibacter sp. DH6]|uniref:Uncharacterized protein n=1 Tax=Panacibacter microcysteis TaxID=2793269 RepID=A0A931E8W7_9BACT|nr:hypothetical protein [Panacibacter microcysteis]MBG9377526.1 hypothetical protein [Panacibacter microcysteis]